MMLHQFIHDEGCATNRRQDVEKSRLSPVGRQQVSSAPFYSHPFSTKLSRGTPLYTLLSPLSRSSRENIARHLDSRSFNFYQLKLETSFLPYFIAKIDD